MTTDTENFSSGKDVIRTTNATVVKSASPPPSHHKATEFERNSNSLLRDRGGKYQSLEEDSEVDGSRKGPSVHFAPDKPSRQSRDPLPSLTNIHR